jgi:hypothetical protein
MCIQLIHIRELHKEMLDKEFKELI